jgi:hypothetical protein
MSTIKSNITQSLFKNLIYALKPGINHEIFTMKTFFTSIVFSLLSLPLLMGQNTVSANANANWIGFMNVFFLDGNYDFGSQWGVPDLKTVLDTDANTVILQPNFNTYADNTNDPNWVNQTTGEGNKIMEGLTFVEPGDAFNGVDLTFTGEVQSYTLDEGYEVKYFIKALDPNNGFADALGGEFVLDLPESGAFSVSVPGNRLEAGLLVQYGFSVTGRNANPANEAALGNVTIGPVAVSTDDLDALPISLSVYPNPVADQLFIQTESEVQSYEVATLLGEIVLRGQATKDYIDVTNLATGTYLITVGVKEGQKTMKFVKH